MTDDTPDRNLLARETSPYLLQHKDNPVHWMPWGEEAFRRARERRRPILLSVGYAACHWCHVMAHESFEDETTATLMNELFVNVKVDREERPDLDQIYQHALALLGQHGGWPLTMFLTHDGEPFWGGTYFPPRSRHGRPGFPDVLRGIAAAYREEPEKVAGNVGSLREALARMSESRPAGQVAPAVLDQVADRLLREVDPIHGGIGTAPKFPQCGIFELLWRAWLRTGRAPFRAAVETTLARMCQGGIYDHLGGGFARYATDERWLVPHFEKMLYDNAEMVDLLTLAWQGTGERLYAQRVRETVGWVLREMTALDADGRPTGAFASTLDADSEGVEGKFYVWSEEEVDRLLGSGPDAVAFKRAYGVSRDGNWEGTNILNRSAALDQGDAAFDPAFEEGLARMRAVLARARDERIRPGWDDKVLTDWNGLMIAALADAGFAFDEPDWTAAAVRAFDFVAGTLGAGGRLHHGWRRGVLRHPASLDDYANMIRAALALHETTGESRFLEQARNWVADLDRHYWDDGGGGYFYTADDAERLLVRVKSAADQAVPSGNGTMVAALARLHHLTGETAFRDRAEALVAAFSGELTRNFFPLANFLNGIELLQSARQIVVVGRPDDPGRHALLDVVRRTALPNRVLTILDPGASMPPGHPAHGKGPIDGRPAAYVCENATCSAPASEPDALAAQLAGQAA